MDQWFGRAGLVAFGCKIVADSLNVVEMEGLTKPNSRSELGAAAFERALVVELELGWFGKRLLLRGE